MASSTNRRRHRRAMISVPIRVRAVEVTGAGPDEISTTLDVSRNGLLFASKLTGFAVGMQVAVTLPYSVTTPIPQAEQAGRVVRVTNHTGSTNRQPGSPSSLADGRMSIAIALHASAGEVIDTAARTLTSKQPSGLISQARLIPQAPLTGEPGASPASTVPENTGKPIVLVVDGDEQVRLSLKVYLETDGYQVIAVGRTVEAHHVLKMFTPALVIAAIEGDDVPGYQLCAHCRAMSQLRSIPVMLLTESAYPSDYANAHALGATVCMAKPYRQERLRHVVRLLAPTQRAKEQSGPVRPADPARRAVRGRASERNGHNVTLKFRPHWSV